MKGQERALDAIITPDPVIIIIELHTLKPNCLAQEHHRCEIDARHFIVIE
jgi:hypothetical protein